MKELQEIQAFLKECGVYYLATMDCDKPRVRPFGTAEIFEGKLYIQTGNCKDVYKQIMKNPHVEICAFKDGKWLRLSGILKRDDRFEARKDMLDKNPMLRGMYDENDGNTEVLYFESGEVVFSSFGAAPRVIKF